MNGSTVHPGAGYHAAMKRFLTGFTVACCAALLAAVAAAAPDPDKPQIGFVFVTAKSGKPVLREAPDASSKEVGSPANGARLVYRRVAVGRDNTISWYRVEPPGGTPGWLRVEDTSDKRPTAPPSARPLAIKDSGIRAAGMQDSATAAGRSLRGNARNYAEKRGMKESADQFVTLEAYVENHYKDPQSDEGTYPEEGPKLAPRARLRAQSAEKFGKGLR